MSQEKRWPVSMHKIMLEVPSWMGPEETQNELRRFLLEKALLKMEYFRGRVQSFERKYGVAFPAFKEQVEAASEEEFERWDDLIEWEAYYRAHAQWAQRYRELSE